MLLVVIIPSYIWVTLILAALGTLTYLALGRLSIRQWAMNGLLVVLTLQAIAGMSVAVATRLNSISSFACLGGAYGAFGSVILFLVETFVLVFLSRVWPRRSGGRRDRFATWVSIWAFFNLIAFLAFMRSAALCTV